METFIKVLIYLSVASGVILLWWLFGSDGGKLWLIKKTLRFQILEETELKTGTKLYYLYAGYALMPMQNVRHLNEDSEFLTLEEALAKKNELIEKWTSRKYSYKNVPIKD